MIYDNLKNMYYGIGIKAHYGLLQSYLRLI